MKHGSLFSGIGGFDLAAEWMGWTNVFHCEVNEFGKKVLEHYWPNAISFGNVTDINFRPYRGTIDIISGGFPCQPYSGAGKRLGKEDERHLWPEMLRAIREIQPRWVLGENVLGLVNWSGGLVFEEVQADLEAEGYEVQPYVLPAAAVNAPHRRDRVWFVAYSTNSDNGSGSKDTIPARGKESDELYGLSRNATDTDHQGLQRSKERRSIKESRKERNQQPARCVSPSWQNFPTKPPICSGDDGLSDRLDNITFPKWRNESIKAYGNAIVPQVAHQIFKAIEAYEESLLHRPQG